MKNKSCCNPVPAPPAINTTTVKPGAHSNVAPFAALEWTTGKRQPHPYRAFVSAIAWGFLSLLICTISSSPARAADAPAWMHSAASAPVPAQDEKTDAVLLYSERTISVQSVDKVKTHVRIAYKILRPGGREYGIAYVSFNSHSKIT